MTRTSLKARIGLTLETQGFRFCKLVARPLGVDRAPALFSAIASVIGPLTPLQRRADLNLGAAMPTLSGPELASTSRDMFRHFARIAIEYLFLKAIHDDPERLNIAGAEHYEAAMALGKGVVLVTGHFGSWEAARVAAARLGHPPAIIYRAFNNPEIDEECRTLMSAVDAPIFHKGRKGTLGLLRHIRKGGAAMILTDQRFNGAPRLPFFGHSAETALAAAELAQQYGATLLPVRAVRRDRGARFDVTFEAPIESGEGETGASAAMTKINARLEAWIRENPEQYFWLHNRWQKGGGAPKA